MSPPPKEPLDDVELQHLLQMRDRTRRRLFKLQEQIAGMGDEAPAHVRIDAEQAAKDLELIEIRMQTVDPSPEVAAQLGVEGRVAIVEWRMTGLADKLGDALTYFGDQLAIVREEAREWRETERRTREERQKVSDERLGQIEKRQAAQDAHLLRIQERISSAFAVGLVVVVVVVILVVVVLAVVILVR